MDHPNEGRDELAELLRRFISALERERCEAPELITGGEFEACDMGWLLLPSGLLWHVAEMRGYLRDAEFLSSASGSRPPCRSCGFEDLNSGDREAIFDHLAERAIKLPDNRVGKPETERDPFEPIEPGEI